MAKRGDERAIGPIDRGALKARLGIPADRPIPASVLREAMRSARRRHDVHEERQILFDENMNGK